MIFPIISDRYRLGYWIWWKLAALYYRILRSSSGLSTLYEGAPSPLCRLLPQSESHSSESLEYGIQILLRFETRNMRWNGTSLCSYPEDRFDRLSLGHRPVQCPLLFQIPDWSDDGHQIHNSLSIVTPLLARSEFFYPHFRSEYTEQEPYATSQAKPGQTQI